MANIVLQTNSTKYINETGMEHTMPFNTTLAIADSLRDRIILTNVVSGKQVADIPFDDIVDKFGTTNAAELVDYYEANGFFFRSIGGGSGQGWDGQVNNRNDLPTTIPPNAGEIYLVENPVTVTVLGIPYKTYQSGLYIRDTENGNLDDWRRLNVKVKFTSSEFRIVDPVDTSKQFGFLANSISSGIVRFLTAQDKSYVIADNADVQQNATDLSNHISDALIHQEVIQRVEGGRAAANTTNQYLRSDDRVPMNLNGQRLNYDTTLVSLMVSTNGAETWDAEVRKNGVVTPVYTESVTASDYEISVPNVDFDADDEIQFYCNGTGINRPKMIGIFQRR